MAEPEPEPVDRPAAVEGRPMTLLEHLGELRTRLIKMFIAFLVASTVAWIFYDLILATLIAPLEQIPEASEIVSRGQLIVTAPQEAFFIRLKVTAIAGFILSTPVILWQVWRFVTPGLYAHEKRYALPFVLMASALFACGATFAFAVLPRALAILAGFGGSEVVLVPRASEYLSFVIFLVVAFGTTFELPVLLLSFVWVGVISSRTLRKGRRMAWILILIVAAFLTPTPDPLNQLILAIPLILLYEGTILLARILKR